jgi:adenosylcobyric acid synthase
MQAEAAGVAVTAEMNPVLLKPEADSFSQVVVMGKPWARLAARDYFRRRGELWSVVTSALDTLREQYDLVVIEGAGSPAELNLKRGDMVNMAVATYADAPVLLVGDIDRGGIFAQLLGTLMLLEAHERERVRGLVVNRFRGDSSLFDEGVQLLQQRGGVPVLGVVPFIRDLGIADEDSVALDDRAATPTSDDALQIAVLRLPHISNFDDFDPLRSESGVQVRFVERAADLGRPDLIILPGSKTTIADLHWLRVRGLAGRIVELAEESVPVLGICGGYQMLGLEIHDPLGAESDVPLVSGLGLLPVVTTFATEKQTVQAQGRVQAEQGLFARAAGLPCTGYEIHMGQTTLRDGAAPLLDITARSGAPADGVDGAAAAHGWTAGTYMHGLFDNDMLRHTLLANLAARAGHERTQPIMRFDREIAYDRLAATVRAHLDMAQLSRIVQGEE